MPYVINHKSPDECFIKYDKVERRLKKSFYISLGGFAFVALMLEVHYILIILALFFVIFVLRKSHPSKSAFDIKIYRIQNSIEVRNRSRPFPTDMIYPLNLFKGFGYSEVPPLPRTDDTPNFNLFFKFDEAFIEKDQAPYYQLVPETNQSAGPDGGPFWKIPIRDSQTTVDLANAKQIISEIEEWLKQAKEKSALEEFQGVDRPPPTSESNKDIIRDFRDVEWADESEARQVNNFDA